MKRLLCLILSLILIIGSVEYTGPLSLVLNADENEAEEVVPDNTADDYYYAFPDDMKASVITIGYDFFTDSEQSAEATQSEIDAIIAKFNEIGLNTIIIRTSYDGVIYYEPDTQKFKNGSPLDMLIDAARENNLYTYITFDINTALDANDITELNERIDYLSYCAHRLTNKYLIDGIILDGYYASKDADSYDNYSDFGSGIGFENWLKDNSAYVFRLVSNAIRATNNTVAVGISINNAWMNDSSDPEGSDTKDDFEALADGYSDTRDYIRQGYADFMIVYCYGGLESRELEFESIVEWWNELAEEADIPMFVRHANERISTSDSKWAADQILKQLEECHNYSMYRGSVFDSFESLKENVGTSTDALIKYYAGLIDTNSLYKELTMVLPKKYDFITYEPTEKFQGSFDSNFDIYFNGEKIELNEAGNFYFEVDLEVGVNKFTFKNKSTTITYKITRKVKVLQSVEPEEGTETRVEGTTKISVSVLAYKGSVVTATLNGKTIKLTEDDTLSDDLDANTNYTRFTGYFTAPEGIVGEEQDLGNIVINGSYNDFVYETMNGSRVIVNEISPYAERAQLIKIKNDNTITYDYYTTDNVATPTCPRLPAGTLDVIVNKVSYNVSSDGVNQTVDYYLTESKLRIKASDCEVIDGYTIVDNVVTLTNAYTSNTNTILNLQLNHQTPFTVSYSPLSYDDPDDNSYLIEEFDPDYVLITFDYVSDCAGSVSFSSDSLFTSAEWKNVQVDGEPKLQLKLKLRKSGIFAGYTASYDGSGGLTFTFNGYRSSLYGAVIVIDPGHGYNKSSTVFDPGAVGHVVEQKINIAIAKTLTSLLQASGATVYMLPTDTKYINLYDRSEYAAQYSPDIFISIHCNSVSKGNGVRGVEAYYFTPFSQPLASLVSKKMAQYYSSYVYGDGKNYNRGAKYNYFAVTLEQSFPSILVECGFVTDYQEAMALNNTSVQLGLANAIVSAMEEYFSLSR